MSHDPRAVADGPHRRDRPHQRLRSARIAAAAAIAVTALLASACSSSPDGSGTSGTSSANSLHGTRLPQPVTLTAASSAATFRSSAGGTTTLGAQQRGQLMLVYFGYTHCPDVCPTTMADIGMALRRVPQQVQTHTQVVFVTADPDRDTPSVMRAWLANFDPTLPRRFVGLTSDVKQIDAVAKTVGVPLEPPVKEKDGSISVGHGAQTLAFVNGKASVVWTAGTPSRDYADDIMALSKKLGSG